jgi:hypothetical protein
MNKIRIYAVYVITVAFLISCAPSTKIVKSWKEPQASISTAPENKVLVVALVKDESSRRTIEDEIVNRLKNKGVQSYMTLTPDMMKDENSGTLDKLLADGKFTHIIIMKLSDIEKEVSYVPGSTTGIYRGYGNYYAYGAHYYSSPGYYTTDKNYTVETMVYSVTDNKLLWAGTTSTINPSNLKKSINELADVVTEQMKKDGFVQKTKK